MAGRYTQQRLYVGGDSGSLLLRKRGTDADPRPASEEYDGVFENLTAQYKKMPAKNVIACPLELGSGKATAVCGGFPGSDDKLST